MSWYGQKPPGHFQLFAGENVIVLPPKRRDHTGGRRDILDTIAYTDLVIRETEMARQTRWSGWIAAQAHAGDNPQGAAGIAWHWHQEHENSPWEDSEVDLHGGSKMLEAFFLDDVSLRDLQSSWPINVGMGWQYPKVGIWSEHPSSQYLEVLSRHKSPYVILEDNMPEIPEPVIASLATRPRGNTNKKRLIRMEKNQHMIWDILLQILERHEILD